MPLAQGYITQEQEEQIQKHLIENGPCENMKEAVQYAFEYTLFNKHDVRS